MDVATHRPYKNRIRMTCADCGKPLVVLERGKTGPEPKKLWPLCDACAERSP
jgi:hypothetical protein